MIFLKNDLFKLSIDITIKWTPKSLSIELLLLSSVNNENNVTFVPPYNPDYQPENEDHNMEGTRLISTSE